MRRVAGTSALFALLAAGCGRDLYDPHTAGRCSSDGEPFGDLAPVSDAMGMITSPSLSADGLTLTFIAGDTLHAMRRPSVEELFVPWPDWPSPAADLTELQGYVERPDGLERFVALGRPADLSVQSRGSTFDAWGELAPVTVSGTSINGPDNEWDPFLSPDGLTLWYQRESSAPPVEYEVHQLSRVSLDDRFSTEAEVLSSFLGGSPGSFSLTAEGREVYFSSDEAIHAARVDGAELSAGRRLVELDAPGLDYEPFIRPDGCEIFWVRGGGGQRVFHATRSPDVR